MLHTAGIHVSHLTVWFLGAQKTQDGSTVMLLKYVFTSLKRFNGCKEKSCHRCEGDIMQDQLIIVQLLLIWEEQQRIRALLKATLCRFFTLKMSFYELLWFIVS